MGHRVQVSAVCSRLTLSEVLLGALAQLAIGHSQRRDSAPHQVSQTGQSDRFHQSVLDSPCQVSQRRDSACFLGPDIGHSYSQMGDPLFNCRQGHVFMVQTKPSKQPLGLVARGVPIEKVRVMHSDWARGATGTPKGRLGRSNFG